MTHWLKHIPESGRCRLLVAERLKEYSYREPYSGCHIWTGTKANDRYGGIYLFDQLQIRAHRAAYELSKGTIPDHLVIDHLCKTPLCVNPDHLEAVTLQENIRRGDQPRVAAMQCQDPLHRTSRDFVFIKKRGRYQWQWVCGSCRKARWNRGNKKRGCA